jgi:putative ABC transport system substrate-binding protein
MDRRGFVIGGFSVLFACIARAQGKVARVGYLSMASPDSDRHRVEGLRRGFRELGYVEGGNLVLEEHYAHNDASNLLHLADDLARSKVDVVVVYGSPGIDALRKKGLSVPVVMTVHADPVGSGVVPNLARPGGNITGLTDGHADLAPKRLEYLKEIVPAASRVGALLNPAVLHAKRQLILVQAAAPRLRMSIVPLEVSGPQDIEGAFALASKQRVDSLFIIPDPSWWPGHERRVADLAIKHRLPAIGTVREFADNGVLAAYGTNFTELWRRSATYVDKILKGAKPGELAIEHPNKFDLVVNLKTAKAIGISVPRAVVLRADAVIR